MRIEKVTLDEISRKPITRSPIFIISVIMETGRGIKLLKTIARAAALPTLT